MKLAERGGRSGKKLAIVATARKLAVVLHHLWVSGEVYETVAQQQPKDGRGSSIKHKGKSKSNRKTVPGRENTKAKAEFR